CSAQPTFHRCAAGAKPKAYNAWSDELSCFSVEIHKEVRRLVNSYPMQLCRLQLRSQPLPDRNRYVLSRWNPLCKLRHFHIEKTMIERVQYFPVHDFL